MKYALLAAMAATSIALAMPAFADDNSNAKVNDKVERGSDGSYSEKGSSSLSGTDANGTYHSEDKSVKANVDANGNGDSA